MSNKNKEAIKILEELPDRIVSMLMPLDIDFDYKQALDLAIKAVKTVNLIEETFQEYPDRMIDIDDWGDIKEEIEND